MLIHVFVKEKIIHVASLCTNIIGKLCTIVKAVAILKFHVKEPSIADCLNGRLRPIYFYKSWQHVLVVLWQHVSHRYRVAWCFPLFFSEPPNRPTCTCIYNYSNVLQRLQHQQYKWKNPPLLQTKHMCLVSRDQMIIMIEWMANCIFCCSIWRML